jgi:ribosome biogenesis protein Nip4
MKFRTLNNYERELVRKTSKVYGLNVDTALKDKKLITVASGRKEVFITNSQTVKLINKMKKEPYSAGLYIGEIKGKNFELDLEGASLIAPLAKKKIIVDDDAEQLVLYGRDVFSNSVVFSEGLKKGEKCIVTNKYGDALALAEVKGDRLFAKNVMDRGWYLRRGK